MLPHNSGEQWSGLGKITFAATDRITLRVGDVRERTVDVRFIAAVRPNGKPFVYRNEDTGWIWPPYFKYDSSNLQAKATDLRSTAEVKDADT